MFFGRPAFTVGSLRRPQPTMATIARTRATMETTTATTWRPARKWESFDFVCASGVHRSLPTQAGDDAYYAAADDAGDDAYYYAAAGDDVRGPCGEIETFLRDAVFGVLSGLVSEGPTVDQTVSVHGPVAHLPSTRPRAVEEDLGRVRRCSPLAPRAGPCLLLLHGRG